MDLKKLADQARAFNANIASHQATAIQQSEKVLVDLNRSQMLSSKTSKDSPITNLQTGSTTYSPSYAAYKGFNNPNLKDTGDFQKDMFLVASNSEWFINSIDWKSPSLTARYGDDIFGIAPSNKDKAIDEASKNLIELERQKVWTF